jgi:hypothetical protein
MSLFKQIHEIVFHGNGGFDWNTVYNMPIWLRKFTFSQIQKHFEDEKEEYEKAKNNGKTTLMDSSGNVNKSEFNKTAKPITPPTYVTKASKK